jgi:hypothetical protein
MVDLTAITQASLPEYRIDLEGKFHMFMPLYLEMKIDQPHLARQAVVMVQNRLQTVIVAGGHGPPA